MVLIGLGGIFVVVAVIVAGVILARRQNHLANQALDDQRQRIEALGEEVKLGIAETHLATLTQASEQLSLVMGQRADAAGEAAEKALEHKTALVDAELKEVASKIERATQAVVELTTKNSQHFGSINNQLATTAASTLELSKETNALNAMLNHSRARGQHGEFAAEGVLQAAGLVENIHFTKQTQTASGTRPEYRIRVGDQKVLSVDVKLPFDNYRRSLEAASEAEAKSREADFFKDVKDRITEVVTRDYIGPETVDFVLLFISSEAIFAYILEHKPEIFEFAMRRGVVLAGPFAFFAVLSVVKRASDNFVVAKKSQEILHLMSQFNQQWSKYVQAMEQLGKKLEAATKAYDTLASTRRSQLERPLNKIEALSEQEDPAPVPEVDEESGTAAAAEEDEVIVHDAFAA